MKRKVLILALVAASIMLGAGVAMAFTLPTDPTMFGYVIYDTLVNKIILGPIGICFGVGALVTGIGMLIAGQPKLAIYPTVGGAALASISGLATSVGMLF